MPLITSPWNISLLGTLQASQDERTVSRFRSQRTGALLAYLALFHRRAHPRETLIELLWPEYEPAAARNYLSKAISSLRHQLEPPGIPEGAVILAGRATVSLNPPGFTTDVAGFEAALDAAATTKDEVDRAKWLAQAVGLYRAELLIGYYESWVLAERRRLAERAFHASQWLTQSLERAGDLDRAVESARRTVDLEPLREEAHVALIRLLAQSGQPTSALRQYQEMENRLQEELGALPSPGVGALVESMGRAQCGVRSAERGMGDGEGAPPHVPAYAPAGRRSERGVGRTERGVGRAEGAARSAEGTPPGPAGASTVPAPPAASPHTAPRLPLQLTRFFGRESELQRLGRMLSAFRTPYSAFPIERRLITVTGPGGSGKTRLAIEATRSVAERFAGAVWFVSLADLVDPQHIPGAIADALRLSRSPDQTPLDQVVRFLDGASLPSGALLLLDNFEQLLIDRPAEPDSSHSDLRVQGPPPSTPAGARAANSPGLAATNLITTLLEQSPHLVCLVTSRRRLDLEGERELPILPLETPGAQHRQPDEVISFASVQLFVDRAQAVRPDFQVTAHNAAHVAAVCGRLEGIPLAIELAAARIQLMTPAQMLAQMERRFDFLVTRRRDAIERHRTLRAAMHWSYRLLPLQLQRFFGHLSVFHGGWTAEAARDICREPLALEYLDQLEAASMVRTAPSRLEPAEIRFHLLETLREFAESELPAEDAASLHERHARWYLALAEEAARRDAGADSARWRDRLEVEYDNLRAALSWCRQTAAGADLGLRLAASLWRFWWRQGDFSEGRRELMQALQHPEAQKPSAQRAQALTAAGQLAADQADYNAAQQQLGEALAVERTLGDKRRVALALVHVGTLLLDRGNLPAAQTAFEEGVGLAREAADPEALAKCLDWLGTVTNDQGDHTTARVCHEECLSIRRAVGDRAGVAWSLVSLGNLARDRGDYAAARGQYEESLLVRRELGDQEGIARSLVGLASMAWREDKLAVARACFEEAIRTLREMGHKRATAGTLDVLGRVVARQGDYARAHEFHTESLLLHQDLGDRRGIAYGLESFADLSFRQGNPRQAARLYGAASALRQAIDAPLWHADRGAYEQEVAAVRAALSVDEFAAEWQRGCIMPLERAIAEAISSDPS